MESAERQYNNAPLPLPSALGAELTHQQEKALLHALEVQQKKRTQNVQELLEAIRPKTPTKPPVSLRKQPTASEIAAAKQRKEAEAAAKQKREAEAAAAKQKREAEAAAKEKREAKAAAAKEQRKAAAVTGRRKTDKMLKIAIPVVCAAAVLVAVPLYILPNNQYNKAVTLMAAGQYEDAMAAFEAMDGYRDSVQQIELCREGILERIYQNDVSLMQQGNYPEAIAAFQELSDYKDSSDQIAACQNAMNEEAYQAAVKLMESGEYEDAKKQFEALGDYKDSKEQIQKCEMELLLIRKNQKIGMMKAGYYRHALAAFWELEEQGIDCSTEIKECELGYLERNQEPYVTLGKLKGQEKKVPCTDEGRAKVHSMTRVDLDNGCVRYTVDCTVPDGCEFVSFFSPPDGDIFMYVDRHEQPQARKTYVFDVLKKDIKKAGELTMWFGQSDGYIRSRNAY